MLINIIARIGSDFVIIMMIGILAVNIAKGGIPASDNRFIVRITCK